MIKKKYVISNKTKNTPAKEWLAYILKCSDGNYYTGITNDLARRLKAHNDGTASKYTRPRLPVTIVHWERLRTKSLALRRELEIKKMPREQKTLLLKTLKQK
jgi:putative endonuclease